MIPISQTKHRACPIRFAICSLRYNMIYLTILYIIGTITTLDSQEPIKIEDETYERILAEVDLEKTKKKLVLKDFEFEEIENDPSTPIATIAGAWINYFAYLILAGIIVFILLAILKNYKKKTRLDPESSIAQPLDEIDSIDTDEALQKALQKGDFRTAIRIQFIKILQYLSAEKHIKWEPDKTNRNYLREIKEPQLTDIFSQTAHIYEWVWYGNTHVTLQDYQRLKQPFEHFFKKVDV